MTRKVWGWALLGALGWMLVQTYHVGVRPTVNQEQDEESVQQAPALTIVRHRQAG